MTPFERAEALYKHAQHCGAPLEQFVLEMSDLEAFQTLDSLEKQYQNPALTFDIAEAKANKNPWPVMNDFTICGFQVVRRQGELH